VARTYTVVQGDTLSGLALRFYGDASLFPLIAAASGVKDPGAIHVGQILTIPDLPPMTAPVQPFSGRTSFEFQDGITNGGKTISTVPVRKRLVLEDVHVDATLPTGQRPRFNLTRFRPGQVNDQYFISILFQNTPFTQTDCYAGGRPIRIYFEAGEEVFCGFERGPQKTGTAFGRMIVSGYFINVL
jgi:LysM domain